MNSPAVTTVTVRDMCVTVTGHPERDKRDTPLWGVTSVTVADLVPMPLNLRGQGGAVGGLPFSLPARRGC
jgi:hypothetical protein